MSDERWIVVPNWDKFQHYTDRDPLWIKNYVALTGNEDYLALSLHARGVLHGIWLEYARSHGQLLSSTLALSRRLGDKVSTATLTSLNDAGFIAFVASRPATVPLALARSREKSREEKKEGAHARKGKKPVDNEPRQNAGAYHQPDQDQPEPLPIDEALEYTRQLARRNDDDRFPS